MLHSALDPYHHLKLLDLEFPIVEPQAGMVSIEVREAAKQILTLSIFACNDGGRRVCIGAPAPPLPPPIPIPIGARMPMGPCIPPPLTAAAAEGRPVAAELGGRPPTLAPPGVVVAMTAEGAERAELLVANGGRVAGLVFGD